MGYTPVEVCLQFLVWALVSVLVLVLDKMVVLDWGFGLVLGFRLAWGFACLCVCVCAARWLSLHQYKYVFIPHRVRGSLRFDKI